MTREQIESYKHQLPANDPARKICDMALRAAESGAVAQPVAWYDPINRDFSHVERIGWEPLYTHTRPAEGLVEITDEMALAFHRAITDGAIGAGEIAEIKIGLRAALLGGEHE